jgi:hypothetical protein
MEQLNARGWKVDTCAFTLAETENILGAYLESLSHA